MQIWYVIKSESNTVNADILRYFSQYIDKIKVLKLMICLILKKIFFGIVLWYMVLRIEIHRHAGKAQVCFL